MSQDTRLDFMEEPRENREKQNRRKELLKKLKIPITLQEAMPQHANRSIARLENESFQDLNSAFSDLIKELASVEDQREKKGKGGIAATLSRLMQMHVSSTPRVMRSKRESPYIYLTSRRFDSAFDQKTLILRREEDGSLRYTCFVSRLTSSYNRLPKVESSGGSLMKWIELFFEDLQVQSKVEHGRPGGVSLEGGYPAQVEKVQVSAKLSSKEQALELFQALQLSQIFMHAAESEVKSRTEKVLNTDWRRDRAYKIDSDTFLLDLIHEKAVQAFGTFFKTPEGESLLPSIVDVNVIVRKDSLTPVIVYQESSSFLGHVWSCDKTFELEPILLDIPIPELEIDALELSNLSEFTNRSQITHRIELPADQRISIAIPFYPAKSEPSLDGGPKRNLDKVLGKWIREQQARQKEKFRQESREKNLSSLEKHLKVLGLQMKELQGKTTPEQVALLKDAFRTLAKKVHPDSHQDDPEARHKMGALLKAKQFFLEESGLTLLMDEEISDNQGNDSEAVSKTPKLIS